MKMLLAALKRIRDKGICGNVRLLVPRVSGRRLGMAVSRECETRHSVEEPAPHLPAQLHDKGAGK